MEIAVLGTNPDVLALTAAAVARGDRVLWLGDLRPDDEDAWRGVLPHVRPHLDWEAVLDHALADIVILGCGTCSEDQRWDRLRRLVADGVPTLVTHPVATQVVPFFEVDMVRQDAAAILRHYNPVLAPAPLAQIKDWLAGGHETVGVIHQLSWKRFVGSAARPVVLSALAQDVEAIVLAVDKMQKVSALGPNPNDATYANLNVQLVGAAEKPVHWTVATGASERDILATLVGEHGQIEISIPVNPAGIAPWRIEVESGGHQAQLELPVESLPKRALDEMERALAAGPHNNSELSTWNEATGSMEIVDAVELSLQRGRMIEVHHQRLTEQLAFKGIMSAWGCGLLILGTLVWLVAGILGDTIGLPLVGWWPLALLALLIFFLVLQPISFLLLKVIPATRSGRSAVRRRPDR